MDGQKEMVMINEQIKGWMDVWLVGWLVGWMNGWMGDGWMDGWMDGNVNFHMEVWNTKHLL